MDNFEWNRATTERFGLHYVNFTDPDRPRTPKASARFFRHLIESNGFFQDFSAPKAPFAPVMNPKDPNNLPMEDEFYYGTFPENFVWSSATASYQVEGAWNEDGKCQILYYFLYRQYKNSIMYILSM
jgi:lactase-phlorizin hydrolase